MASGLPIAFCFLLINVVGAMLLWNGRVGLEQLTFSMWHSVATFIFLPIPMFILLGEVTFRSGMAMRAIDSISSWMGRLPGRLGLIAVATATLFSTMSGSTTATTALLGEALVPEMEKRGYKKPITIGSVMGSGGLAMLIPPSGVAVVVAAIAEVSVGKVLIAIIIPGFLIALFYALYIVSRCYLQPSMAPPYDVTPTPLLVKLKNTAKYILPLGFIIFMVTGLILLGVATPAEAAVMGALASIILAAVYRKLSYKLLSDSITSTLKISVMILLIISGAKAYGMILAITGATQGMVAWVMNLPLAPIMIIIGMQAIHLFLGMFMTGLPQTLILIPIFIPMVIALGFDPVWFIVIYLINSEMGHTTPPFGVQLFVMQGVTSKETTFGDIVKAGIPFLICDAAAIAVILAFPIVALWLPSLMMTAAR
jgi:tripartite ATP-independent transporter DctM subunit